MKIQNPILKGFNPDPSIIRVGEVYYIATSTFEWWPGVQIHMSLDLVNWKLIGHPLNEKRLLDMTGNPTILSLHCTGYHPALHLFAKQQIYDNSRHCSHHQACTHSALIRSVPSHHLHNTHGQRPVFFRVDKCDGKHHFIPSGKKCKYGNSSQSRFD